MRKSETDQAEVSSAISVKEAGRRGGHATLDRQGVGFFRKIGKKGGQRTRELYGELLKDFGKKGGRPRRPTLAKPAGEWNQREKEACGRPTDSLPQGYKPLD